ncbi:MAG: peroxiredoxin-like family protein [Pseudomonadota bacterium]
MKLSPGAPAPIFSLPDLHGQATGLQQYRGRKLLLSFYRYASCPFCNLRVHQLSQLAPAWQARGLDLVAVFQSPRESILEHAGKEARPFAILPDPGRGLYRAYGVEGSWGGFLKGSLQVGKLTAALKQGFLPGKMEGDINMVPADFIIGEDGRVLVAYYGRDISDHLPVEVIEQHLR